MISTTKWAQPISFMQKVKIWLNNCLEISREGKFLLVMKASLIDKHMRSGG